MHGDLFHLAGLRNGEPAKVSANIDNEVTGADSVKPSRRVYTMRKQLSK
jgi:hypothetical protein